MAIAPPERLVDVQQALHEVLAGRHVRQAERRIAERAAVDDHIASGLEALDVDAESLLRPVVVRDLKARLLRSIRRQQQQHPAVERSRADRRWIGQRNAKPARRGRVIGAGKRGRDRARNPHRCRQPAHRPSGLCGPKRAKSAARTAVIGLHGHGSPVQLEWRDLIDGRRACQPVCMINAGHQSVYWLHAVSF